MAHSDPKTPTRNKLLAVAMAEEDLNIVGVAQLAQVRRNAVADLLYFRRRPHAATVMQVAIALNRTPAEIGYPDYQMEAASGE